MKTIAICASIEHTPKIIEIKKELKNLWYMVKIPYTSQRIENWELNFEEFMKIKNSSTWDLEIKNSYNFSVIKRHYDEIKNSDAILVLNEAKKWINNYIWWNTLIEISFAHILDKPFFLYNEIPERSERMHYVDEILTMKPIILNWDLDKIKEVLSD
jgi:hypothetical protein